MEQQGGCWMWEKRRHALSALGSATNRSYDGDSWEEQAFAEDAAGNLGGCTWPPRFYSCSFCRREFRSAQALGGHMNVHRRDRARLKQFPGDPQDKIAHHELPIHLQNSIQNPFSSLSTCLRPSQVCGLAYSTNPNSDPTVRSSSVEASAVPAPPTAEILFEDNLFPSYTSSMSRENYKAYPVHSTKPCTTFIEEKNLVSHDEFNSKNDSHKVLKMLDAGFRAQENYLRNDLAVSLNWVVRKAQPTLLCEAEEESKLKCKRRRIDSSIPFFIRSSSVERHRHSYPKVFEISPSPMEELDLELRLGDRPKVQ